MDITVVGHVMKEFIRFPDRQMGPVLGSPAAYASVVASRLGAATGLASIIGSDMPPELMDVISQAHVDIAGVRLIGSSSRIAVLTYDERGRKRLVYIQAPRDVAASDIPDAYLESGGFLICPINGEVPVETVGAIAAGRRAESTLMTDLGGYVGAAATPDKRRRAAASLEDLARLVSYFDVVKASVEDCEYVFCGAWSPETAANQFVQWGAGVGIVTLGDRGSVVATRDGVFQVPAIPADTVDCTGAGDAYSAAFLVEYVRTADARRAALYASAAASIVVEATGGVRVGRMPLDTDVSRRLAKRGWGSPR